MKPLTQVAVFVVLVFAVPWIVAPWLPQQPQNTWELILSYLPGVWAPTVIAVVMTALERGLPGRGHSYRPCSPSERSGSSWRPCFSRHKVQ